MKLNYLTMLKLIVLKIFRASICHVCHFMTNCQTRSHIT